MHDECSIGAEEVITTEIIVHYSDVILGSMVFPITGVSIVCPTVCPGADQRKHQRSAPGFCKGNPPVTGRFPSQKASNARIFFIWWRHHAGFNLTHQRLSSCRLLSVEYLDTWRSDGMKDASNSSSPLKTWGLADNRVTNSTNIATSIRRNVLCKDKTDIYNFQSSIAFE